VLLLEGTYHLDGAGSVAAGGRIALISVAGDQVCLQGQGCATRLLLDDEAAEEEAEYVLISVSGEGFCLRDMKLEGNSGSGSGNENADVTGLRLGLQAEGARISGCAFAGCSVAAADSLSPDAVLSGCSFGSGMGLLLEAGCDTVRNCCFDGCDIGISAEGGSHSIVQNRIVNCMEKGMDLQLSTADLICGNVLQGQPVGCYLEGLSDGLVRDNLIRRDGAGTTYAAGEYSLYTRECSGMTVIGNLLPGKALTAVSCTDQLTAFAGADWNPSA